jgi:hypothetical protein
VFVDPFVLELRRMQLEYSSSSRLFQHGGGSHLGKWRRTVGDEFFGFSGLFLVCVPSFIPMGSEMAKIQSSRVFQHGGGGHLGKWRRTLSDKFRVLSRWFLVCAQIFIKIG